MLSWIKQKGFQCCRVKLNDKPTILLNILKFRQHLEELPENSIAEQCLIISKELAIPSSVYQICSRFCKEGKNTTRLDDIQQINKLEISKLTKNILKIAKTQQSSLIQLNIKLNKTTRNLFT